MGLLSGVIKLAKTANKVTDDLPIEDIQPKRVMRSLDISTDVDDVTNAKEMLGNKEAIDQWKKQNKVPKEESKRRKQRKFSEQAKDLQQGIMSGPEYRTYIKENQPATSFTDIDLQTMLPSFRQVVGALTKDKSDSGILGLNTKLKKGSVVSSRLDIPAYNEHDVWVTSIVDKEKGKLYGRTAVLKNVNFDMTNRGAKKLALDIATEKKKTKKVIDKKTGEKVEEEYTQTKTPFATMKGEWQDTSDKDAFALAEKYINDPDWVQVGFNPERHSFFYDKATMMPVFNADEVVQIGALVLAKVPKLNTPKLRAERIGKLRKLRIEDMPEGLRPTVFNEGGIAMEKQMDMFEEGGLRDEGGMIDKESGNEVPIGSTRKEVRDDIPAQVSEGEFVFPADVVRFLGLEKLMEMRQAAKMGLKQMEAMGQMGNSDEATMPDDMPFGMADLVVIGGPDKDDEPKKKAQGGLLLQSGGSIRMPDFDFSNQDVRIYVKEGSPDRRIPFFDGEPVIPIPAGYVLKGSAPVEEETETEKAIPTGSDREPSQRFPEKSEFQKAGGWDMDTTGKDGKALDIWIKEAEKFTGNATSVMAGVAALINPLMAAAIHTGTKYSEKQIIAAIDEKITQAGKTPIAGQVKKLKAIKESLSIEGKKKSQGLLGKILTSVTDAFGITKSEDRDKVLKVASNSAKAKEKILKEKDFSYTPPAFIGSPEIDQTEGPDTSSITSLDRTSGLTIDQQELMDDKKDQQPNRNIVESLEELKLDTTELSIDGQFTDTSTLYQTGDTSAPINISTNTEYSKLLLPTKLYTPEITATIDKQLPSPAPLSNNTFNTANYDFTQMSKDLTTAFGKDTSEALLETFDTDVSQQEAVDAFNKGKDFVSSMQKKIKPTKSPTPPKKDSGGTSNDDPFFAPKPAIKAAVESGSISEEVADNLSGEGMEAGAGIGAGTGGSNITGPMNRGGLASRRK